MPHRARGRCAPYRRFSAVGRSGGINRRTWPFRNPGPGPGRAKGVPDGWSREPGPGRAIRAVPLSAGRHAIEGGPEPCRNAIASMP